MPQTTGNDSEARVAEMLAAFTLYDAYVDIVCAFEMICTKQPNLAPHVKHFERFPKVTVGGKTVTPDFTVLFKDGTAAIGELARFALRDESVDSLCSQIGHYDTPDKIPGPTGDVAPAGGCNVLLIVPMELSNDAVNRVVVERCLNEDHDYSPSTPPVVIGWNRDSTNLLFVHNRDQRAGTVLHPELARFFVGSFKPKFDYFAQLKVTKPFMNDPVDTLYLASRLWATALQVTDSENPPVLTDREVADLLQRQYGRVSVNDVKRALTLLASAGMIGYHDGTVTCRKVRMNVSDRESIGTFIAARAARNSTAKPPAKRQKAPAAQETLF